MKYFFTRWQGQAPFNKDLQGLANAIESFQVQRKAAEVPPPMEASLTVIANQAWRGLIGELEKVRVRLPGDGLLGHDRVRQMGFSVRDQNTLRLAFYTHHSLPPFLTLSVGEFLVEARDKQKNALVDLVRSATFLFRAEVAVSR